MTDTVQQTPGTKHPILADPRVPLAAERTFLAWIRTGLALMGFGFVVARFGMFLREWAVLQHVETTATHGFSMRLGIVLVSLGVILNLAALLRYRRYLHQLATGVMLLPKARLETAVAITLAIIGVALVQISPAFNMSTAQEGLVGASALIGIFLGAFVGGWLTDKFGGQVLLPSTWR